MEQNKKSDNHLGQVRWKCRRGMLELDLLLNRFVDAQYVQLSAAEQQDFLRLLDETDVVLWDWFLRQSEPQDKRLAAMVECILKQGGMNAK